MKRGAIIELLVKKCYLCCELLTNLLGRKSTIIKMSNASSYEREFEELFRQNYSRLFYFALDYVEDEDTAKDIVGDMLSDVWANYARLRSSDIARYMARAVKNRALNHLKHLTVQQNYRDSVLRNKELTFADDLDAQEERLRMIESVMQTLSDETRLIFEECYFNGKKYREQADEMGISVSAINKHMNKAFAAFRAAFAKKCEKSGGALLFSLLNLLL